MPQLSFQELLLVRFVSEPGIEAIEEVNPAKTGFLGGFGLPIIFSWIVGAVFAGGLAFIIGKVALGLRADYLAIATLLISEIVIAIIKHEDWLTRGVKNVIGLKRPAPYEVDLQQTDWFINLVEKFNFSKLNLIQDFSERQSALNQLVIEGSSIFVKLCYSGLFLVVVIILLILTQKALYSPWGRMMRAIRDNEEAANAMGKNVVKQHLVNICFRLSYSWNCWSNVSNSRWIIYPWKLQTNAIYFFNLGNGNCWRKWK